jgi:TonB family protein
MAMLFTGTIIDAFYTESILLWMKSILLISIAFYLGQFQTNAQGTSDSTMLPAPPLMNTPPVIYLPEVIDICGCGDQEASFPGGETAMQTWIKNNTIYPRGAKQLGIEGRVYVVFVVETDGSISNVEVIRGVSYSLNQEAIRLIKSMPYWISSEIDCNTVRTRIRVPISFILT